MKQKFLAVSLFFALTGPAFAAQQAKTHTFEVAPEVYYHNYEEPGVMEQEGVFYGIRTGYAYHQGVYGGLEASTAFGQVDYTSPASGTLDDIDDWLFETRALGGCDFDLSESVVATPFFGFGYRYLNDDSAGRLTNIGAAGYERESNYFYSPIGLTTVIAFAPEWKVRASGEYDLLWKGKQKSHLSDAIAGSSDVENDQEDGFGLRGSLGIEKVGTSYDFLVEGFIRYWDIDDSDVRPVSFQGTVIGAGFEPAYETVEIGAAVGIRF